MPFTLTNTGVDLLRGNDNPPIIDFEIRRDGGRWVFYHPAKKNAVAVFTGGTSVEAVQALKMYLITRRLTA